MHSTVEEMIANLEGKAGEQKSIIASLRVSHEETKGVLKEAREAQVRFE